LIRWRDLPAPNDATRVLFVGHYDSPGPRTDQAGLAGRLAKQYPNRSRILHMRVAHGPEKAAEETLRSRSFVFLALGLYAAQALGPAVPLLMSENGLIALNIPLAHPSRRGSCSTRTMHTRITWLRCGKLGSIPEASTALTCLRASCPADDPRESANDLRAIVDFLQSLITPAAMRKRILATALVADLDAHAELACRGFNEVREWLESDSQPQTPLASKTHA
jgi:hypothetical protein